MSDAPTLTVVIPTYNGRHLLATCLASLERCWPEHLSLEVVVADDGSTDGTGAWLARAWPWVRLVRLERNAGFCAAANAGIAVARGRFLQLLNNDTEVTPGWAGAGLAPFVDSRVGSVAPLVLLRRDPSRVDSAGDAYAFFGWPYKRGHGEPAARWADRPAGPVFGAGGSAAFYRTDALRAVGGFDPSLGSYYEDVDLAFRLRWAGYTCVHAPRSRILHDISASYDHARPELQRRMARNAELIFWADLPPHWIAAAWLPHLAFTAAQGLARALRGRFGPFAAGKRDALRMLPEFRAARRRARHTAVGPRHFPMALAPLGAVGNHGRRPRETTAGHGT
jgi:GT2 family glycosyltransferase